MDTVNGSDDENNDYVSDSCSESSQSDYDIDSQSDNDSSNDIDLEDEPRTTLDFSVPNIKKSPPVWTDKVESITVPPPKTKGGPNLPSNFGDESHAIDYFQLFFTDSLINNIVRFMNQYAHLEIIKKRHTQPNYVDKQWAFDGTDNVSVPEMCAYLGACIILSVNPARQLRHVFSSEPFLNNTGLHSVFTLHRFSKISHYFCVSDKTKEIPKENIGYDKLFKVRPVVEQLQKLFKKYWKFGHHICIDESVISMKCRDGAKQYMPGKPHKWGWKVWSCCDSDSPDKPYLLSFIPYLGKKHTTVSKNGLFFDVVQELTKPMRGSCVRLYTDSAYTSLKTFLYLKKHSIFCSGTCKKNTMGLHPSVRNAPTKMPRRSHRIFQDENEKFLTCCLWFDTKPVRFISTEADPTVIAFALHWVGSQYVRVNQPSVALNYAQFYKSIDYFDSAANRYSILRHSYRPWHYLFGFCLQAAIINAYILYVLTSKLPRPRTFCQSDFRLLLGKQLIGNFRAHKYEPKL